MKASLKRIIWALGWYLIWILDDLIIYLRGIQVSEFSMGIYQATMLLIWFVPLILFKDDKEK